MRNYNPGHTIEIQGSPWGAAFTAVVCGLAAVAPLVLVCHLLPSARVASPSDHIVMASAAVMLLALAAFFARRALSLRGPVVTMSPAGLRDSRLGSSVIPWHRILDLSFEKQGHRRYVALVIDTDIRDGAEITAVKPDTPVRRRRMDFGEWPADFGAGSFRSRPVPLERRDRQPFDLRSKRVCARARGRQAADGRARSVPRAALFHVWSSDRPDRDLRVRGHVSTPEDLHLGPGQTLSAKSLMLDGGLARMLVDKGQWWRFFTAPLLHADPFHILMNGISLVFGGYLLERLIGWRWFGAVFVFSALTGATASFLFNPVNMVTVGASGGIVGLFSAALVIATRYPSGPLKNRLMVGALQILVPTLIPFVGTVHGGRVDVAAHIGGAFGGSLIAVALLAVWSKKEAMPRYRILPMIMMLAFAGCALFALTGLERYRRIITALDPSMPPIYATLIAQSAERLRSFPRDPRVAYARAIALYNEHRVDEAKTLLDEALLDRDALDELPGVEDLVRALSKQIADVKARPRQAR